MDYFGVNIRTLPNNPSTGQQFTSQQFLECYRRNIKTILGMKSVFYRNLSKNYAGIRGVLHETIDFLKKE